MKFPCLVILLCIMAAGPVAAASADPAAATPVTLSQRAPVISPSPDVTLPSAGMLEIVTVPPGASLFADGTYRGTTPFRGELSTGNHTILITLPGYRNVTRAVTVPARGMLSVTLELERLATVGADRENPPVPPAMAPVRADPGTAGQLSQPLPAYINLTIRSIPQGAKIWLNGTDTGLVTPGTLNLSRTRIHMVNLTLTGYREFSHTINLSNVTIPINVTWQLEPVRVLELEATLHQVPAYRASLITPGVPEGNSLPDISPASTPQGTRVPAIKKEEGFVDSFIGFFSGILTRPDCPPSLRACGKQCVDLQTDASNCGLCGYTCPAGASCSGGECFVSPGP